ncbi:hypothetical protein M5K25_016804 [Dendrobium thyrsiflorum]|uniref:Uncharacterized protein n=1 Tax=Dendrobium thyrsiflorum TaxID=117978 RepID=A0ABD0UKM2_DENTH
MQRRASSKKYSSQGRESGPARAEKPYSISARSSSSRKIGWLRCTTRTTKRFELRPTHTATCPAGTTSGAAFLHRRTIWRSRTTPSMLLPQLFSSPIVDSLSQLYLPRFAV